MVIALTVVGAVVLLAVVVWMGTHMVAHPDPNAGSVGDAFGAGLAVFDPGKARADDDLASKKHQSEILPTPDEDEDHPVWKVDLHRGTVRVPRPR